MARYISLDAAAEELSISIRTLRRLIARGDLRAYRVGASHTVRIDRTDIAEQLLRPIIKDSKGKQR